MAVDGLSSGVPATQAGVLDRVPRSWFQPEPSPGHCRHLGDEPGMGALCRSVSLCLSLSQPMPLKFKKKKKLRKAAALSP